MFYNFFMERVREDKKEEAEETLKNGFKKQEEGTFTKEYFMEIEDKYFSFIKEEYIEDLKEAMKHFSSNL